MRSVNILLTSLVLTWGVGEAWEPEKYGDIHCQGFDVQVFLEDQNQNDKWDRIAYYKPDSEAPFAVIHLDEGTGKLTIAIINGQVYHSNAEISEAYPGRSVCLAAEEKTSV